MAIGKTGKPPHRSALAQDRLRSLDQRHRPERRLHLDRPSRSPLDAPTLILGYSLDDALRFHPRQLRPHRIRVESPSRGSALAQVFDGVHAIQDTGWIARFD